MRMCRIVCLWSSKRSGGARSLRRAGCIRARSAKLAPVLGEQGAQVIRRAVVTRMDRFDQCVDSRRHHEEVARPLLAGVPERMGDPPARTDGFAGTGLDLLAVQAEGESAGEHVPDFIVFVMDVHWRLRLAGRRL